MLRRLFTLLSALSLLLCVATAVLWVRSYWVCDSVGWLQRHDRFELAHAGLLSEAGALEIDTVALRLPVGFQDVPAEWKSQNTDWRSEPADPSPLWRENLLPRSHVESGLAHGAIPVEWRSIRIPYWLVGVILFSLLNEPNVMYPFVS